MLVSSNRRPRQLPVAFSPLCVYWFDGAADTTDRSGNGRTLTIVTSPTEIAGPAEGKKCGYAGRYTRADAALRIAGDITVVALVQPDNLGTTKIIAACGAPGSSAGTGMWWSLGAAGAPLRFFAGSASGDQTVSGGRLLLGDWQLVHLRRTGGTAVELGVNGVTLASGTVVAPGPGATSELSWGGAGSGTAWGQGLAGAAVWASVLTDQQLRWLARACLGIAP